jgi:hypothetical protein
VCHVLDVASRVRAINKFAIKAAAGSVSESVSAFAVIHCSIGQCFLRRQKRSRYSVPVPLTLRRFRINNRTVERSL